MTLNCTSVSFKILKSVWKLKPTKQTSQIIFSLELIDNVNCYPSVRIVLTLSFTSSKQHKVVFDGRGTVRKRKLQLEFVEDTEARDGGISHEGGVTKLITSTESGTSDIDGCKSNTFRTRSKAHICTVHAYGLAAAGSAVHVCSFCSK